MSEETVCSLGKHTPPALMPTDDSPMLHSALYSSHNMEAILDL